MQNGFATNQRLVAMTATVRTTNAALIRSSFLAAPAARMKSGGGPPQSKTLALSRRTGEGQGEGDLWAF